MRKVLLFLAIFGIGLAALLYFRQRSERPQPASLQVGERPPGEPFTEIPLAPDDPDGQGGTIPVLFKGPIDVTQFESEGADRKPIRKLHADDSQSLGGNLYVLRGMRIEILDPATGKTKAELTSPRTRLKIDFLGGKPTLGEGDKAVLSDVQATLHEEAPVVPLTFEIKDLEYRMGENRLLSQNPVKVSGPGLRASGGALDADLATGRFVLPTSGSIELDLPEGVRVKLAATGTGPIEVQKKVVEGRQIVELVASEGAQLSATGAEPFQLDADTITLHAREAGGDSQELLLDSIDARGKVVATSRGDTFRAETARFQVSPEGRLQRVDLQEAVAIEGSQGKARGNDASLEFSAEGRPTRAHVEGDVVLEHGEDVFRARAADFEFGPEGKLAKATLAGDPSGSVAIGRFLPPDQTELRAAHAQLSGPGPLVLEFGERMKVNLTGPGDLKIPETNLAVHAERSLVGEALPDQKTGNITADGAVRVTWGADDLESERVTLSTSQNEMGETIVDAASTGETTIHRTLPDGARMTLVATDGLETHSVGKKLVVTAARGVDIRAEGPGSFHARAATVRDFDWEARAFVAEGDVAFESERGVGSADRVVARGHDDVELAGSAGKPARFSRHAGAGEDRFEEAKIEGLLIHARENSLDATGDVRSDPRTPVKADFTASDAAYHLEGGEVHVEFDPLPAGASPEASRPFRARAAESVRAWVQTLRGESTLACEELRVSGATRPRGRAAEDRPGIVASEVKADGAVVVDWNAQGGIAGAGDHFVLDPDSKGRLFADPGGRVRASGRIGLDSPPYDLDAEWVEFDPERLEGRGIDMRLRAGIPAVPGIPEDAKPKLAHLSADHFRVTPKEMLLEGNAHVDGLSENLEPWSVDAGSLRIVGNFKEKGGFSPAAFEVVQAWDGFDARLGIRGRVRGTRIASKAGTIRLEGQPAELVLGPVAVRSAWIEYTTENMLLATDKGEIGPVEGGDSPWSITYEALQPFDKEDKTILALRNPIFVKGEDEVRSSWMLFWIDREEWRRSGRKAVSKSTTEPDLRVRNPEDAPQDPAEDPDAKRRRSSDRFGLAKLSASIAEMRTHPMAKVLSEAYIGGNIELTEAGARRARASAVYLDIVEGHGWVRDADFTGEVGIRGRDQQMRIRAEWMRVSSDLSLRADKATLTFCGYDEPHYVVETGDLRLDPSPDGRVPYDVSATRNALRFANGWAIPLPPLVYSEDEEGNPLVDSLNMGQSAKFGTSIGASFNIGLGRLGKNLGRIFAKVMALPKDSVKGHWSVRADILGSRGLLLGTGLELKSGDRFKLEAEFSVIPDGNEDRGLVRVDEDERSTLRDWFRARGRYSITKKEWYDLALSIQSDPGVQSEFFEGDYLRYEQKDNFLHWRKANEAWLYNASAKVLLEDRTDTEELPKAGVIRGRAPVASLGGLEVLHTGYVDAAYLRRREGDASFAEPGDPIPPGYGPYTDGLGEREVARVDTVQRFEAPFSLGFAGLRATPWVSGRATMWDEGIDPDDSPQRATATAGFDLSTTFWRYYGSNVVHALVPFASVHGDFASSESGGDPVRFDATEDSIEGKFVDLGLRSRVWNPVSKARFDLEVRATHAADLPGGQPDGFQPVGVLAELLTWMGSVPFGISHDGRYDVEDPDTVYSRSFVGARVHPKWDIEFGYHEGVGATFFETPPGVTSVPTPYEAISAATRYRATKKWELELSETISTSGDEDLASSFLLRRLGHDFVTEIEFGYTAGEGSRFSINLTPLVTSKEGALGLMDRWLGH